MKNLTWEVHIKTSYSRRAGGKAVCFTHLLRSFRQNVNVFFVRLFVCVGAAYSVSVIVG